MRYALISDIHGNLPAFEAVLNDAAQKDIDSYIFLGDYTLSMHFPNEIIHLIRNIKNKYVIKGNAEDYLDNIEHSDKSTWTQIQFEPIYWCHRTLTSDNREYLRALPVEKRLTDGKVNIYAYHSSSHYFGDSLLKHNKSNKFSEIMKEKSYTSEECLNSIKQALLKDTNFNNFLSRLPDGVYAHGHNHIQMHLNLDSKLIVNPGSCGFPLDYPNYASYSILDISNDNWSVEELRIEYDIEKTIINYRNSDLYKRARVWCEIMIKHLKTGTTYDNYFLNFIEKYAEKPYSVEDWENAYELWSKTFK